MTDRELLVELAGCAAAVVETPTQGGAAHLAALVRRTREHLGELQPTAIPIEQPSDQSLLPPYWRRRAAADGDGGREYEDFWMGRACALRECADQLEALRVER